MLASVADFSVFCCLHGCECHDVCVQVKHVEEVIEASVKLRASKCCSEEKIMQKMETTLKNREEQLNRMMERLRGACEWDEVGKPGLVAFPAICVQLSVGWMSCPSGHPQKPQSQERWQRMEDPDTSRMVPSFDGVPDGGRKSDTKYSVWYQNVKFEKPCQLALYCLPLLNVFMSCCRNSTSKKYRRTSLPLMVTMRWRPAKMFTSGLPGTHGHGDTHTLT